MHREAEKRNRYRIIQIRFQRGLLSQKPTSFTPVQDFPFHSLISLLCLSSSMRPFIPHNQLWLELLHINLFPFLFCFACRRTGISFYTPLLVKSSTSPTDLLLFQSKGQEETVGIHSSPFFEKLHKCQLPKRMFGITEFSRAMYKVGMIKSLKGCPMLKRREKRKAGSLL